jgi:tetratricopeptide (TPR) repeat protein
LLLRRGDLAGAEPALLLASRRAPRDARLLEALGAVYGRTDRWQKAEEAYRAAIQAAPGSLGAHLGLAQVLLDTGRYPEALEAMVEARRLDPQSREAQVKEALLLLRTGQVSEAKSKAGAVLSARPGDVEARYVLAQALEQAGELEGAAAELGRVLQGQPDHLGALSHLATVASRLGRTEEAERARQAHRDALARRRIEERVRGHRLKGVEAFNREDYQAALVEFETIAREDPSDFQAPLYIGSTLLALGRREEARRALARSLEIEPRNERALMELGRLEALEDRLDAAVDAFRRAIAVNPEFAEPHYFLAAVHTARGEREAALQETRRYEELRARSQGSAMEIVPPEGAGR